MATLTRWEPFREMRRLHDMLDRVMDQSWVGGSLEDSGWLEGVAPIDVYQTDESIIIEAAMPGVRPEDINISVTGDTLTLRGEVQSHTETEGSEGRRYHIRERRYRSFARSLTLPALVDADKADAEFENGMLVLTIPKAEESKPKQITVKAKK